MFRSLGIHAAAAAKNSMRSSVARGAVRFNSSAPTMNWPGFFKMRKELKTINVVTSTFTGLLGAYITFGYLANIEIDVEQPIWGVDPTFVMGGALVLGGVVGYLAGPSIGIRLFNMKNSTRLPQFKAKEREFLQRVQRNRADPSSNSFSNPVPDYYGEKINSLEGYKQWLRDCNGFRRKTQEFL